MSKASINLIAGIVCLVFGIGLISISLTLGPLTSDVISGTVVAHSYGAPTEIFQHHINGLLAGGRISLVPVWVIRMMAIFGILLVYFGSHVAVNRSKSNAALMVFYPEYWKEFQRRFQYKTVIRRRKRDAIK